MESILISIKKLIGIDASDTSFDTDIVFHINTAFMSLTELKVGPSSGFVIVDDTAKWTDFIRDPRKLAASKSYVFLRVKLLFDSTSLTSAHIDSINRQIDKLEWLLNVGAESTSTGDTPSSGGNGIDGVDGVDGFSPIVEITEIENGHRITITDVQGTSSFDIPNGINGSDGAKGDKGDPYTLTDTDKNTIVNAVLDALPTWNGGAY